MMQFKDHPIKIIEEGGWLSDPVSENVKETLLRINQWVEENELIVLNVETLLFPELKSTSQGTGSSIFETEDGESRTAFYQVFRVWYKDNKQASEIIVDELV